MSAADEDRMELEMEEQAEDKQEKQKRAEQKAAQQKEDARLSEVRQALHAGTAVVGTELVLKRLRSGRLVKVFLAKNCPAPVRADIEQYAALGSIPVTLLPIDNEEFGIVCKKNFFVAVLGISRK